MLNKSFILASFKQN